MTTPLVRFVGVLLAILLWAGASQAATPCNACHTMHNSQNNAFPVGGSGTANPKLLIKSTCLGCHARAAANDATDHYFVLTTTAAPTTTQLAGGNFYWTEPGGGGSDRKAHNVSTLTNNVDTPLGNTPPGGAALASTITCAGTTGCHGNRVQTGANEMLDLGGAHHSDATGQILGGATTPGASYRFLKGIGGYEDPDREFTVTAAGHNEYLGEIRAGSDAATGNTSTMSYLCSRCHGTFHSGASNISSGNNFLSPWVRHPTSYRIPNSGEYAAYYTAGYDIMAPVARSSVPSSSSSTVNAVAGTDAIIMCLSCHRAHGSAYDSIMRWDYKAWPGDSTQDGCQRCHSTKN